MYMKEQRATDKKILSVRTENIPEELKARPQWVVWQAVGEKPDKVPYSARTGRKASSTDLMTWSTFEEALEACEHGDYDGVGYVFCSADPYVGIDMDDCRDPETGEVASWADEVVRALGGYAEVSPSGTGVHVIVRGKAPNRRRGPVEVYSTERFFTVTGRAL